MPRPTATIASLGTLVGVLGVLWHRTYEREANRSDRLEAEVARLLAERGREYVPRDLYERVADTRDRMESSLRDRILPAIQSTTTAVQHSFEALVELHRRMEDRA